MFQLRDAHREAFEKTAYEAFEDAVVRQLRDLFADRVRAATDDDIRARVRACIPRARAYGLATQYQVMCFIDATYLLGEQFDTDPRYPTLRELLASPLGGEDKAGCLLTSACGVPAPDGPGGLAG